MPEFKKIRRIWSRASSAVGPGDCRTAKRTPCYFLCSEKPRIALAPGAARAYSLPRPISEMIPVPWDEVSVHDFQNGQRENARHEIEAGGDGEFLGPSACLGSSRVRTGGPDREGASIAAAPALNTGRFPAF